jgi:nicotinamidase/pyrazinamidase
LETGSVLLSKTRKIAVSPQQYIRFILIPFPEQNAHLQKSATFLKQSPRSVLAAMIPCLYNVLRGATMKNLFFVDVDTQRDFMLSGGALYVPGAERMIPKLRRLFDFARKNEIPILSSVDAHSPDDPEFRQFPAHCVQGTEGQRKLDETLLPRPLIFQSKPVDRNLLDAVRKHQQIIVEKQSLNLFSNPVSERLLRVLPPHAIVFGVTTEYCVKLACLGIRRMGIPVALVTDVTRALAPKTEKEALEEMRVAGVEFIALETLMGAGAA